MREGRNYSLAKPRMRTGRVFKQGEVLMKDLTNTSPYKSSVYSKQLPGHLPNGLAFYDRQIRGHALTGQEASERHGREHLLNEWL